MCEGYSDDDMDVDVDMRGNTHGDVRATSPSSSTRVDRSAPSPPQKRSILDELALIRSEGEVADLDAITLSAAQISELYSALTPSVVRRLLGEDADMAEMLAGLLSRWLQDELNMQACRNVEEVYAKGDDVAASVPVPVNIPVTAEVDVVVAVDVDAPVVLFNEPTMAAARASLLSPRPGDNEASAQIAEGTADTLSVVVEDNVAVAVSGSDEFATATATPTAMEVAVAVASPTPAATAAAAVVSPRVVPAKKARYVHKGTLKVPPVAKWTAEGQPGWAHMRDVRAAFEASALLVTICGGGGVGSNAVVGVEEGVQRGLWFAAKFLTNNLPAVEKDSADYEAPSRSASKRTPLAHLKALNKSAQAGRGRKVGAAAAKKLRGFAGKQCIPVLTRLLQVLEPFCGSLRHGDRTCLSVTNLSMRILNLNSATSTVCEHFFAGMQAATGGGGGGGGRAGLHALQMCAIGVLRLMMKRFSTQRNSMLQDLYPLLEKTYQSRKVDRSHALFFDGGKAASRADGRKVTMPFIALLTMLQSSVSPLGGVQALEESAAAVAEGTKLRAAAAAAAGVTTPSHKLSAKMTKMTSKRGRPRGAASKTKAAEKVGQPFALPMPDRSVVDAGASPVAAAASSSSTSSSSTSAVAQYSAFAADSLCATRELCASFVNDLFRRLYTKDLQTEARGVIQKLAEELLLALSCPDWPVASMLLSLLLRRTNADLSVSMQGDLEEGLEGSSEAVGFFGAMNVAVGTGTGRLETAQTTFLLDLLATIGVGMRTLLKRVAAEQEASESATLGTEMTKAVGADLVGIFSKVRRMEELLDGGAEWQGLYMSPASKKGLGSGSGSGNRDTNTDGYEEKDDFDTCSVSSEKTPARRPALTSGTSGSGRRSSARASKQAREAEEEIVAAESESESGPTSAPAAVAGLTPASKQRVGPGQQQSCSLVQSPEAARLALEAHSGITAAVLEAVLGWHGVAWLQESQGEKEGDDGDGQWGQHQQQQLVVPSAFTTVQHCRTFLDPHAEPSQTSDGGDMRDGGGSRHENFFKRILSCALPTDAQLQMICLYLLAALKGQASGGYDIDEGPFADGSCSDALFMHLSQWLGDASGGGREGVAANIFEGIVSALPKSLVEASPESSALKALLRHTSCSVGVGDNFVTAALAATGYSFGDPTVGSGEGATSSQSWRAVYSTEWIQRATRTVLAERALSQDFERTLRCVQMTFSDTSPQIRARGMKTLAALIHADPLLIQRPSVRATVSERFNDGAISVREEAVRIVGKFVLMGYSVSEPYLDDLMVRLHDRGVSVRKAVVAILRDILMRYPKHPRYAEMCRQLLGRGWAPKEEETIKDMVRNTFQLIWFSAPTSDAISATGAALPGMALPQDAGIGACAAGSSNGSGSDDGTSAQQPLSSTRNMASLNAQEHLTTTALQMMHMVDTVECQNFMIKMTREMLHGSHSSSGADNKTGLRRKRATSLDHCHMLLKELLELVLQGEEGKVSMTAHRGALLVSPSEQVVAAITTIGVFCEAHPPFVSVVLPSLLPFLKGDSNLTPQQDAAVCGRVTEMLSSAAMIDWNALEQPQQQQEQHAGGSGSDGAHKGGSTTTTGKHVRTKAYVLTLSAEHYRAAEVDLCKIALKFGAANIDSAVRCLSLLAAHITYRASRLLSLSSKCFDSVQTIARDVTSRGQSADAGAPCTALCASSSGASHVPVRVTSGSQLTTQETNRLQRCLSVLGAVCKHSHRCMPQLRAEAAAMPGSPTETERSNGEHLVSGGGGSTTSTSSPGGSGALIQLERNREAAHTPLIQLPPLSTHPETICGACYSAAMWVLTLKAPMDKRVVQRWAVSDILLIRAAHTLSCVFAGAPRLMLLAQESGALSHVLSDTYSTRVHERLLHALRELLCAEERRQEEGAALELMKESGVTMAADSLDISGGGGGGGRADGSVGRAVHGQSSESDASVPGFVMQAYQARLLTFLAHTSKHLRIAGLQLLGTLLRQGMVCPLDIIGHLVALQGDPEPDIRQESLRLLHVEDETHPTFLNNRLLDGVELCFDHQLDTLGGFPAPSVEPGSIWTGGGQARCVFSALYVSCVRSNRRRRADFLVGMLKRCEVCFGNVRGIFAQLSIALGSAATGAAAARGGSGGSSARWIEERVATSSDDPDVLLTEATTALQHVAFMCHILASLPYETSEETLMVVTWISRNIPLAGTLVAGELNELLSTLGGQSRSVHEMQPPAMGSRGSTLRTTQQRAALLLDDGLVFSEAAFQSVCARHTATGIGTRTETEAGTATDATADPTALHTRLTALAVKTTEGRCLEALLRLQVLPLTHLLNSRQPHFPTLTHTRNISLPLCATLPHTSYLMRHVALPARTVLHRGGPAAELHGRGSGRRWRHLEHRWRRWRQRQHQWYHRDRRRR
jgi:hypothetical protein